MSIYELNETVPVIGTYDIIVLGGGIAGISAAVSSARLGCRTLMVEKLCNAGGLAAGGLISYYLPICDGKGKIVSRGIAQELFLLATETAPAKVRGNVGPGVLFGEISDRVMSYFYPAVLQTVLDGYLEDNGVDILFDSAAEAPVMVERKCEGVIICRREGRALYRAGVFVDTTGDASILHKAGAGTVAGDNLLSGWYYTLSAGGFYELRTSGADAHEAFMTTEGGVATALYRGLTSAEVTAYVKAVKKKIWQEEGAAVKAGEKIISVLPSVPQLRCHRRLKGREELTAEHRNRFCETSVGCVSDWREPGIIYEIPFGILFADGADNILTAGRTVSAAGDAYEVIRCIPQCAATGQAAGTAAALMVSKGVDECCKVNIGMLQTELEKSGVLIHYGNV